jgi:hypothetical protein
MLASNNSIPSSDNSPRQPGQQNLSTEQLQDARNICKLTQNKQRPIHKYYRKINAVINNKNKKEKSWHKLNLTFAAPPKKIFDLLCPKGTITDTETKTNFVNTP